jgi:hypothetical protein
VALRGEPRLEVGVTAGAVEVARELRPRRLHVRHLARSLLAAEHAGAQRAAPLRPDLVRKPEQVPRVLAQPQLALLEPERAFHRLPGEVHLPDAAGAWVDPVDHQVEVRVVAVAVGDDHGLVLGEPEVGEEPVGHADHERAVDGILQVEADGEVVDGGFRGGCPSRQGHHGRSVAYCGRPDVPGLVPGDAAALRAVVPVLQVGGEIGEAGAQRLVPDHRSLTAFRIPRNAAVAASASAVNPTEAARSITS